MTRASKAEVAQRINHAFTLLKQQMPPSQMIEQLIGRFGVSKIQAYRYVQQAKATKELMLVPQTTVVFTVKLPRHLIQQVRKRARSQGISLSQEVSNALQEYLA